VLELRQNQPCEQEKAKSSSAVAAEAQLNIFTHTTPHTKYTLSLSKYPDSSTALLPKKK
jgi:hypothetical protein